MCGPTVGQRVLYCVLLALLSQCWASVIQPQRDTTSVAAASQLGHQVNERIFNGQQAQRTVFPSVVSLEFTGTRVNPEQFGQGFAGTCTGSIINEHWILTAAHCVSDYVQGISPDYLTGQAKAGITNFNLPNEEGSQTLDLDICIPYSIDDPNNKNRVDVGLCKVKGQFQFTEYVQPMPIISGDIPENNQCVNWTSIGYGSQCHDLYNQANSRQNGNLYFFNIQAGRSLNTCEYYETTNCFDLSKTQSTVLPGDSGGPLICDNGKNQQVIVGTLIGADAGSSIQYFPGVDCPSKYQYQFQTVLYTKISYDVENFINFHTRNETNKPTFRTAQNIRMN